MDNTLLMEVVESFEDLGRVGRDEGLTETAEVLDQRSERPVLGVPGI